MSPLLGGQGCTATKPDGSPCKNLAVRGAEVCRWHGNEKTLARDRVSLDVLRPAVQRHLKELARRIDALDEIARLRAWRDYVEEFINKAAKGKPTSEQVKVLIEANKAALSAVEAQTRIEYNKANVITQKDAAQFITVIISVARQTIHNHRDLTAFLTAVGEYFSPDKVVSIGSPRSNGHEE